MSVWNSERTQPFHRVGKKKFVRDIMLGLEGRKMDRKEADAQSIIDPDAVRADYMHNKRYLRGKKSTMRQYQV